MGKVLRISLKLNFTPNTLGCYGLNHDCTITEFVILTGCPHHAGL